MSTQCSDTINNYTRAGSRIWLLIEYRV